MVKMSDEEIVPLVTVTGALEADMRRAVLESYGIKVMYRSDHSVITGGTFGPMFEVTLMVRADQVEKARRILDGGDR